MVPEELLRVRYFNFAHDFRYLDRYFALRCYPRRIVKAIIHTKKVTDNHSRFLGRFPEFGETSRYRLGPNLFTNVVNNLARVSLFIR